MPSRLSKTVKIDEILADILENLPRTKEPGEEGIVAVWPDIVGAEIAQRARPGLLRDGILFVKVTSSAWVQELEFMKDEFVERLNEMMGEDLVCEIRFEVGPV